MNVSKLAGLDTFISYLISSYLSTRLLCARTLLSHAKNGSFWSFKKVVVWAYQHPFSFENLFPNFQIFLAQKDDRSVAEYFYAFELRLNYCFQLDSNEYHDGKIKNKGRCETTLSLNKVWWWECDNVGRWGWDLRSAWSRKMRSPLSREIDFSPLAPFSLSSRWSWNTSL